MSQFGWGLVALATEEDFVPAYRWDREESPYYSLRPDRFLMALAESRRLLTYAGLLEHQAKYHVSSRGGGGPSVQTQSPPSTSSKDSRQDRASAQVGKSGAPARASTRGSRSRRKSCPKGHYWSYKQKKCLKSKFK